jgi:hypothetical protein
MTSLLHSYLHIVKGVVWGMLYSNDLDIKGLKKRISIEVVFGE